MIRPEPDSFGALLRELALERFGPIQQTVKERPSTPAQIAARRRALCEALDGAYVDDVPVPLANVVPLRPTTQAA